MDEVDWSSLHKILSDPTRRSILELLAEKGALGYTEMMTVLAVTNTGRLNYHLKVLGDLVSKDDRGMYRLSERGLLAANLLKNFPERAGPEKRSPSALKIAVSALLILVGISLIVGGSFLLVSSPSVSVSTGAQVSLSNVVVPQNTTIWLEHWTVPANSSPDVSWSATSPLHIYVLNSTQYGSLLLQYSTASAGASASVESFLGTPGSWVSQFYLQSGNVLLTLPEGQYYFFASSGAQQSLLDTFQIAQTQRPQATSSSISPITYLLATIPMALGIVFIVLALSIIGHRVWR